MNKRYAVGLVTACALLSWFSSEAVFTQGAASSARRPAPLIGRAAVHIPLDLHAVEASTLDPCGSLILDGGFETGGIPSSIWDPETSTNFGTPLCDVASCGTGGGAAPPRTGNIWAWFGGIPAPETATLGQTVTIAANSSATLTFWLRIGTVSSPFTDVLRVRVDGTVVQTYTEPSVAEGAYTQRSINLNAYATGSAHVILFEYVGPSTGTASFTVDDVALDVCAIPPPNQKFATSMSPVQETPAPGGSPTGSGVGLVTLNAAETQITVAMFYAGMTNTVTAAHIHGSATSTPGTNGPVIFDLVPSGGTAGNNTATTFAISPAQLLLLRSGLCYINVHTITNPAGEIRGQLHPGDLAANADADGNTDAAVFRPSDGTWYTLKSSNGGINYQPFGLGTDVIVPGDYDGDGKYDVAVWRPSIGTWYVLRSSNLSFYAAPFGATTDIPVPADYDKDGKTDIAVFRPSVGDWYIQRSSDGVVVGAHWGMNGDRPMPADYDRDGKADLAVFRPTGGFWYILNSSDGSVVSQQFGLSTDKAAAADYDGDGKSDVAVFRANTSFWYILKSSTGLMDAKSFGAATDLAVPGDFDSDAKTDVAVFRPSDGNWYILTSFLGTLKVIPWGLSGDVPVPSIRVR